MNQIKRVQFALLMAASIVIVMAATTAMVFVLSGEPLSGRSLLLSLVGGIAGAGIIAAVYLGITRSIYRRAVLDRVKAGSLTAALKQAQKGNLAAPWEDIIISVNGQEHVIPLAEVHDRLVGVLVEADRMSGQLNDLAQEIQNQATRLSRGAEDQSSSVADSTASVSRIDSSIREVDGNLDDLTDLGENVSSSTQQVIANIEQVSANAQDLSRAVEESVSAVEQIVTNIHAVAESTDTLSMAAIQSRRSMEDIDRATRVIRDRAEQTAGLSEAARERAAHTKELLGRTVQGVRNLAATIETTRKVMAQLGVQSRSIGEITTVISSVAADTHLLSLNASIMAAKAGEHGRGFAVVAQEIKTLAQRTAESAREIENLILETREAVDKAIHSIEEGTERAGEGMRLSEEADQSLADVLKRAEVAAEKAHDIARDTYHQAEVSQEVVKAVEEVAKRTELIQAAMREQEESSSFVRKRMAGTQTLTVQVAKAMSDQAESSQRITAAMNRLTSRLQGIKAATEQQAQSSAGIVRAIDTIRQRADLVAISAQNVSNTSMSVLHQSLLLRNELKGLRLPEREAKYTLGLLFDNLREERWQREKVIFERRAAELGFQIEFRAADGDPARQQELGSQLVELGVHLLIVVAIDAEAAAGIVERAKTAGIPVIAYDRLIKNCNLDLFVSFDAVHIGAIQAETAINKTLGPKLLLLAGSPTDVNAHMLYSGQMKVFRSAIEGDRVKIVEEKWVPDWDPEQAYRLTREAIKRHGPIDAVVASNDGTAGGAIRAIQELLPGRRVAVTGMDTELSACRRIVEGTQTMTVYMPIKLQASRAMEAALLLLRGEEIPGITDHIDNGFGKIPSILLRPIKVDAENLEEVVVKEGYHPRDKIYPKAAPARGPGARPV